MPDTLGSATLEPAAPSAGAVGRLLDRRVLPCVVLFLSIVLLRFAVALLAERPLIPTDEVLYKNMAYSFFHTGSFYNTRELGFYGPVPNVLYPLLIAPSFYFHGNFFVAIKLINALLAGAALFPAYGLAREFVSPTRAWFAALLVALLPSAALAAFVATDVLNLPLFLCCLLYAYRSLTRQSVLNNVLCGLSTALLFLSKPGAVGFVAGLILACLALCVLHLYRGEGARSRRIVVSFLLTAGTAVVSFVCLNLALTGRAVYDLGIYRSAQAAHGPATFAQTLDMVVAHLATPLTLYFIPFFVVGVTLWQLLRRRRAAHDDRLLVLLVLGMAVSTVYVLFTARFTVTIFDHEGFQRLHARYHYMAYAFSLLGLVVCLDVIRWTRRVKALLVVSCLGTWLADGLYFLPKYVRSPLTLFDNPDLAWAVAPAHLSAVMWALSALALVALAAVRPGRSPRLFVGAFLAVLLCANVGEARHLAYWDRQIGGVTDEKTRFVSAVLADGRPGVVVFDSQLLNRLVLAFWRPYHYLGTYDLARGSVITEKMVPPGARYVVLFDSYELHVPCVERYRKGQCSVCEVAGR